jgi:hypothetical protein
VKVTRQAAIAAAAIGFVVLIFAASSGEVEVFHDPPRSDHRGTPTGAIEPELPSGSIAPPNDPGDLPDSAIVAGIAAVLLALLAVMIVYAVTTTWFRRLKIRRRLPPAPPARVVLLPDVAPADVVLDVEAQLDALATGTPRNAIVACWLRLEEDVAKAGLPRHQAETSAEFTSRVLASLSLDAAPVVELAALYREARFSTHPMDQLDRDRALTALRQIHAALGARSQSAPEPVVDR